MHGIRAVRNKTLGERKNVICVVLILIFVCLLAAIIVVWKLKSLDNDACSTIDCLNSSYFLLDLLDADVNPCDNFYNFTCGNYKGHLLVHNFQNEIDRKVHDFITNPINEDESRSVKLQKQYYQACMNVSQLEENQNETLKKLYEELGGWPVLKGQTWNETDFEWGKVVEKCKDIGMYYDWFINVRNIYETFTTNKLYITFPDNTNEIENTLKKKYVALMTNVAVILGAPGALSNISESMNRVMEFEIGLSKIVENLETNATDRQYSLDEIKFKYPNIPWSALLKYLLLPINGKIIFNLDDYIPQLEMYLNQTDKRVLADYIFWKLTESFSEFLTYFIRKEFESYANFSKHYEYVSDRKAYCYSITSTVFGYVSEAEFVRKHTVEKESVKEMVDLIKLQLHKHIYDVTWLTDAAKCTAYEKLGNMTVVIGGPEEMYDEDEFSKFLGIDQIELFGLNNAIEIICEVDKKRDIFNLDFRKPKLTVKLAHIYQGVTNIGFIKYMPDDNVMFLPAAALGGIFYSPNRANYLNYGAIGTIIGHELAHGFGLMGNLIIGDGVQRTLWTNTTIHSFVNAAKCLIEDCNNIGIENSIQMQCNETFEENFADYAGINLSYEAYLTHQEKNGKETSLPGLKYNSNQLFWIIYSSLMCNNIDVTHTESFIHMLPFQRIVGAFRNSEYFPKDFDCPIGSNMNPKVKCKVL